MLILTPFNHQPPTVFLVSVRKTFFDTAAMSSIGVIRMLAQFLAIPILARFLSPADYGLVGMAMPFVFLP